MSDEVVGADGSGGQDPSAPATSWPPVLAAAFVAAWGEVGGLTKGKTANAGTYSYNYADLGDLLDLVRPAFAKHGLALVQPLSRTGGGFVTITTILVHTSGATVEWTFDVQAAGSPQAVGSAITYGRRYSAQAALGVAAEDDDGAAAKATTAPPPTPKVPRQKTPSEKLTARAMVLFGQYGLADRDDRLAETSRILARDVGSWTDLDDAEKRRVIDVLESNGEPDV